MYLSPDQCQTEPASLIISWRDGRTSEIGVEKSCYNNDKYYPKSI